MRWRSFVVRSGRVGTNQDGCLASPRLATILDALTVFCLEQASVDNRDVPVSLRLDKLNVIVSGRRCHDVHQNKNPLNGGPTQEIESDIETRQEKKEKKEWDYCSQEGTYRMKRKQIPVGPPIPVPHFYWPIHFFQNGSNKQLRHGFTSKLCSL